MNDSSGSRIPLHRDNQQWLYDWMVKEVGRGSHFQGDGRGDYPRSVRSHAMISKHLGLLGRKLERIGAAEAAAGHAATAGSFYFAAALRYMNAQHSIFENTSEKRKLHSALLRCHAELREVAPYRIEHVDIPWNGTTVSGLLHLAPVPDPAPCVFYIPGCDITKESWPNPYFNQALERGMHVFSFDGPGQGESNLRGVALTADNYEDAASHALDYLVGRPEVDSDQIGVYGLSFGSRWALRVAAHDHRVRSVAAPWATYGDLRHLMNEESPRFKQLFSYLTQAADERSLDDFVRDFTLSGYVGRIECPVLLACGEYDPRSPLDEVYEIYDEIAAPTELWVFEDQHHMTSLTGGGGSQWQKDMHALACDWLLDRARDVPLRNTGVVYLGSGTTGPNGDHVITKRHWHDDI
jgi:dienelactone hydrolase